jgi:hypothetical protein
MPRFSPQSLSPPTIVIINPTAAGGNQSAIPIMILILDD